ncbi:MAG: hypothetical protein HZB67_05835 [Candidatus Aenigmarchaeota archaeon]|nr:hypothetical protein [Candidatus Aenigmarchaeota archaeon]
MLIAIFLVLILAAVFFGTRQTGFVADKQPGGETPKYYGVGEVSVEDGMIREINIDYSIQKHIVRNTTHVLRHGFVNDVIPKTLYFITRLKSCVFSVFEIKI